MSDAVQLGSSERGDLSFSARLISDDDGSGCFVELERWTRSEWSIQLSVEAADNLLDALEDGGAVAMQRLGGIVAQGRVHS